ncbi:MAG TPA: sugar ABC transporter permease [Clostridia bacterium]|jgi:arabinogalactan oligomer/maltooligosaccharide transport system permease protein|nr:MAG: Maltose transport system permease protein MalG [Firmicutes bacterium ADurb.Bin099]HNZ40703.1 sugar ABC transporter permease [Clostridia bacterium]HPY98382.1 sugar ABC transporter permease [Clostridia bacterium]HQC68458.1 sugar ABC transporter permease [Clostridia bacterium]
MSEKNENVKVKKIRPNYLNLSSSEKISRLGAYILLIALCLIWLYPIVWIVLNAFRTEFNPDGTMVGTVVSHYWPKQVGWDNFKILFTNTYFPVWFRNTLVVAVFTCILSTMLNMSVSYVMSKVKFKMRKPFMNIAMVMGLFPGFMSMIAIYYILKALGLTQTLFALILCYSAGAGLGFYVGKGFFDTVPNALIEAARIDGAGEARIFATIILPISKPIIVYTALMSFTGPWMDFIFARVILGEQNTHLHTVAVGLYYMMYGQIVDTSRFTVFAAGCVCVAIPIVALFMYLQKYYIEGSTAGSVKG